MAVDGIAGLYVETRNWGRSVAFWQALGYELEFETDHHSGSLRHPAGGAWIFLAERPGDDPLDVYPVVLADDAATFVAPTAGEVEESFVARHWDVVELMLRDPDGRRVSVQAPLPEGVEAPAGHG